ncbi:uncharacterized protein LOC105696760 [Orussus abietinus]|uniref:uncharacterized protein LOC105696760 n=1 Tax=Orussus abietinus TaxID=222816 RepID=UPI000626BFFD|nr:uncharacterized protein LOC105696760 [Orussus abietinus]
MSQNIGSKRCTELDILRILRKEGYSLTHVNSYGENLLHICAVNGCTNIIKEILQTNQLCNVDQKNKFGWTPLMQAIRNGHVETVKLLLQYGSDVNESTYLGMSVIGLATAIGKEMLEIVSNACPVLLKNVVHEDITPLCIAALKNDKELFFTISRHHFDISIENEYTHLMIRKSTVPEIASLAKTRLELDDYWNDNSDLIEVESSNENVASKSFTFPDIDNKANEDDSTQKRVKKFCNDITDQKDILDTNIPAIQIRRDSCNNLRIDPNTMQISFPVSIMAKPKSLISPNLTYNRDTQFPLSPGMFVPENQFYLTSCETMQGDMGDGPLNSRASEIVGAMATTTIPHLSTPPLNRCQEEHPSDSNVTSSTDDPNVTLTFVPEFSPVHSPHIPRDINDDNSVFGENTPTPPRSKIPLHREILSAQQNKMVLLLEQFGLNRFIPLFLEQEVDAELFLMLNDEDLLELGITNKLDRIILLEIIMSLINIGHPINYDVNF